MEIEVTSPQSYSRIIAIKVPADEVANRFNALLAEVAKKIEIPGFRKGKVPIQMVERMHSLAVAEDLAEDFAQEGFEKAIEQYGFRPLFRPHIEGEVILIPGESFSTQVRVEVFPKLENVNYKGFKLTKRIEPVSEQEIDSALEDLRVRTSRLEPVGERGAIEGDIMLLDFQPKGTDKPIRKVFTVSKEGTIVLEGHKPDDAFEAHFEFPENFPDKPLAGKILDADIKIVEVKKLVKPEFNEEFFAQLGDEIKNIETLRARIKEDLEHKHLYEAGQILGREAQDMLVNLNPFELPPSLIEIAANDALKENWDIEKIEDSKKEELLNWLKPRVTRDISAEFILEEIAEIEKVAIGDDELKEHVAAVAKSNNIPPEELYRYWQTENKLDSVRRDLEREKALGIVIKNAEVTE